LHPSIQILKYFVVPKALLALLLLLLLTHENKIKSKR